MVLCHDNFLGPSPISYNFFNSICNTVTGFIDNKRRNMILLGTLHKLKPDLLLMNFFKKISSKQQHTLIGVLIQLRYLTLVVSKHSSKVLLRNIPHLHRKRTVTENCRPQPRTIGYSNPPSSPKSNCHCFDSSNPGTNSNLGDLGGTYQNSTKDQSKKTVNVDLVRFGYYIK